MHLKTAEPWNGELAGAIKSSRACFAETKNSAQLTLCFYTLSGIGLPFLLEIPWALTKLNLSMVKYQYWFWFNNKAIEFTNETLRLLCSH